MDKTLEETSKKETAEEHYINKLAALASDAGISVTAEHLLAFTSIFLEKKNVFVTGGAGVGKTTFVKTVVIPMLDYLGLKYGVTASTGIAGSHLEGQTLNSWMGFGLGIGNVLKDMRRSAVDLTPEELLSVYNNHCQI